MKEEKKWYVVYTRPRWEKKVSASLHHKGIENFCPLNKVTRQWSDRKKVVLEPLFKGYVFVCPPQPGIWEIKNTDGILNYVYWLGKPAVVREDEINTIKNFLQEFDNVEVTEQFAVTNDNVIIKQGILMNYRGIVLHTTGNKATVNIESMGLQLTAVFDRTNLMKV